jgi:hypothetical protein
VSWVWVLVKMVFLYIKTNCSRWSFEDKSTKDDKTTVLIPELFKLMGEHAGIMHRWSYIQILVKLGMFIDCNRCKNYFNINYINNTLLLLLLWEVMFVTVFYLGEELIT